MTNDIDDLIRDAARRQAELAVDPDRIRAALSARTARRAGQHRSRTMAAVAAGVAVVVALTVPAIALQGLGGNGGPAATPAPDTAASTGPGQATNMAAGPLRYRPTWLPPGMVERSRSVPVTDTPHPKSGTDRLWSATPWDAEHGFGDDSRHIGLYVIRRQPDGAPEPPSVAVAPSGSTTAARRSVGHNVDINGKPGYVNRDVVSWPVSEHTELMLSTVGLDLPEADLLRIARSVQPDDTQLRGPLHLDWLPGGISPQHLHMAGNTPTEWEAKLVARQPSSPDDGWGQRVLSVYLGPAGRGADIRGTSEELTIGGRPARLVEVTDDPYEDHPPFHRTDWLLVVDLGQDRQLSVYSRSRTDQGPVDPLTREEIIRVAEHVELDPDPDLGWLGR